MSKLKTWLKLQREGIFAGIGVALLLYYANFNLPINIPAEGITKLIILIIIFGGIGAILDYLYAPNK